MVVPAGEVVLLPRIERDRVDDLGAVVPVRAEHAVPVSGGFDFSNVLPFVRTNDNVRAPAIEVPSDIAAAHRPDPAEGRTHRATFMALSMVIHGGLAMLLWHEPPPLASIGTEVISVEITLGATAPAGIAPTPGENETESASAPDDKPTETEQAEEKATEQPQEVQVAEQETAPEVKTEPPPDQPTPVEETPTPTAEPETPTETKSAEAPPAETAPTPPEEAAPAEATPVETPVAQTPPEEQKPPVAMVETPEAETATAKPTETPPDAVNFSMLPPPKVKPTEEPVQKKKPEPKPKRAAPPKPVKQAQPARERRRLNAPTRNRATQDARASQPSTRANNVGIGRSSNDTNYRGLVAAHLARYKQYPAAARSRGDQGTATVNFSLDGGGRVTSVRLVRGSGFGSIDAEVTAMVRRASPFPAPPSGRGVNFTVPVSFRMN